MGLKMEFNMSNNLIFLARMIFLITCLTTSFNSVAESAAAATSATATSRQSLTVIKLKITEFLETQTIGYPGKVSVHAGAIDPNLKLAQCPDVQVFMPTGSRAWGKTSVGVRCGAPNAWTIYVQATVNVMAQYLVASSPLAQGQIVTDQDVMFEKGDI